MLKRAAEFVLAHGGPAALAARRRRGSTLILAYHNVVPDGASPAGDRSLHLPFARFEAQMDRLAQTHQIVDLATVRDAPASARRPRAAVTFDDAYRGALSLALPALARRGIPATVFVAPGLLGSAGCWWDLLAARDGGGLAPAVRDHVLETLQGDGAMALEWARTNAMAIAPLPAHAGIATEDELSAAAAIPGVRFGAHTWTHRNLARVDTSALEQELVAPLAWLRQRFDRVLPWLAYPYGLSAPDTAGHVRSAGYEGALRIDGGWVAAGAASSFVLPRLNVPSGVSRDGFILRASGVIGG